MQLGEMEERSLFRYNGCLYGLISKHGNGLALVRQITDSNGQFMWEALHEHVPLTREVQGV